MQPARYHLNLGQAGRCKCVDLLQAGGRRDLPRLLAMFDRDLRPTSRGRVQEPCPVMPSGAAMRVARLVDNPANFFQGSDLLGVLSQRVLDLCLLEYGVDPAQPVQLVSGRRRGRRSASSKYVSASVLAQPACVYGPEYCVIYGLFGMALRPKWSARSSATSSPRSRYNSSSACPTAPWWIRR